MVDEKSGGLVLTMICCISLQKEFSLCFAVFSMNLNSVHSEIQLKINMIKLTSSI